MEVVYSTNLDINSLKLRKNRRMLVSVKPAYDANRTINGVDIETVEKDIITENNSLIDAIDIYRRLTFVKDIVNHELTISVPDFNDPDKLVEMRVSTALVYQSKPIKDFYIGLLQLMKDDYHSVLEAIESHNKAALSNDNIRAYVMAKISSLGMTQDENNVRYHYQEYADEYCRASEYVLIDPLNIDEKIHLLETWIDRFYNTLEYKLAEVNATTRIWIDLTKENEWGYISIESDNSNN